MHNIWLGEKRKYIPALTCLFHSDMHNVTRKLEVSTQPSSDGPFRQALPGVSCVPLEGQCSSLGNGCLAKVKIRKNSPSSPPLLPSCKPMGNSSGNPTLTGRSGVNSSPSYWHRNGGQIPLPRSSQVGSGFISLLMERGGGS